MRCQGGRGRLRGVFRLSLHVTHDDFGPQTEEGEAEEQRWSEGDALLEAHYDSLCEPDRRLLPKLWEWRAEMTNWLRGVARFAPDARFVTLMPNIVLILLVNGDHARLNLLTPFSLIRLIEARRYSSSAWC